MAALQSALSVSFWRGCSHSIVYMPDAQVELSVFEDGTHTGRGCLFKPRLLIAAGLFAAAVGILSHVPQDATPQYLQTGRLDKVTHFLAYAAMTLVFRASVRTPMGALSTGLLFIGMVSIGVIDEVTQPFVSRTADPIDLAADVVGVAVSLIFFAALRGDLARIFLKRICSPPGSGVESQHTERSPLT